MRCEDCGYDFERVELADVAPRLRAVAGEYAVLLDATSAMRLGHRPEEAVWSPLEYSCHVRDVLLNLRDRILLALVEDRPVFAPIHREERASLARYAGELPTRVAAGIELGADLLAWVVEGLEPYQRSRVGVYAGVERDVAWIARQADHEATHHLLDARRGLGDGELP